MSLLVDRRPAVAPPVVLVLLAPRRLLGWVAAAGAHGLAHPPG